MNVINSHTALPIRRALGFIVLVLPRIDVPSLQKKHDSVTGLALEYDVLCGRKVEGDFTKNFWREA